MEFPASVTKNRFFKIYRDVISRSDMGEFDNVSSHLSISVLLTRIFSNFSYEKINSEVSNALKSSQVLPKRDFHSKSVKTGLKFDMMDE